MNIGTIGVWYFCDGMSAPEAAQFAQRIEALGYPTLWIPEALGREAFSSAAWLLANTTTLNVATGIANIYARDAMTMAAGRNTLAEQSGGRFLLGMGVSHRPLVTGVRGHDASKPYSYMRNYLEAMAGVPFTAPSPQDAAPMVLGALHPKMLTLAAAKTQGAHPYLVPPEHTAFAREQLGPEAWLCVEQKVVLCTDAGQARAAARTALALYLDLPNYRRNIMRWGMTEDDFSNGGSDRLVDLLVAWGDEAAIRDRIGAHYRAGATHVCIQPVHPDGVPMPDWRVLEMCAPGKG